jgi:hypothetical protein
LVETCLDTVRHEDIVSVVVNPLRNDRSAWGGIWQQHGLGITCSAVIELIKGDEVESGGKVGFQSTVWQRLETHGGKRLNGWNATSAVNKVRECPRRKRPG